ncbi:MAG: hypothetical protein J5J00_11250 [Deltaproteobacteria bacterium]|nr:hypothetical protein [Deltaproteobacteria bacterium]
MLKKPSLLTLGVLALLALPLAVIFIKATDTFQAQNGALSLFAAHAIDIDFNGGGGGGSSKKKKIRATRRKRSVLRLRLIARPALIPSRYTLLTGQTMTRGFFLTLLILMSRLLFSP